MFVYFWLTEAVLWGFGNHFCWFLAFVMKLCKQWTKLKINPFFNFLMKRCVRWLNIERNTKIWGNFILFRSSFFYNDSQIIILESKNSRKNIKNQLCYLGSIWQQEEGQLTSADVLYQMVGLCDYKNVLLSYVQCIWVRGGTLWIAIEIMN